MSFDVSIVIVNWNTRDILRDCLRSIYEQTRDVNIEVIVIDNASSDDSSKMVSHEFPQVVLIENRQNVGFAKANNQGFTIAKGRYVLLLNPDTVILDGAIQKAVQFADGKPSAGVIGIRTERANGQMCLDCFQYASIANMLISIFGLNKLFPKSRLFGRERYSWWDYRSVKSVEVVAGCFMLVRREVLDLVGGLDEKFFMYGEEMDWCRRITKAGWKILFYPEARIIHHGAQSSSQNPTGMRLEQRKSFLYFFKKHYGVFQMSVAVLLLFLSGLFRLAYWLVRWPLSQGETRIRCTKKIRQSVITAIGI